MVTGEQVSFVQQNPLFGKIDFHSHNGAVNFEEDSLSLQKNKVHIDEDDWQAMTAGLLDDDNKLDRAAFPIFDSPPAQGVCGRLWMQWGDPIIVNTQERRFTRHICV